MSIIPILLIIIVGFIVLVAISNIKIVSQSEAYVVERLGAFKEVWDTGVHFKTPFIESIAKKVSLKEKVLELDPQAVITEDNVTINIDTVIYYTIMDPKRFAYGAENPIFAIENLIATTLRNAVGSKHLDKILTSREDINASIRNTLDDATDAWGVKVNRVEIKDIVPPQSIKQAMEMQVTSEREKRALILQAEGQKLAAIRTAEGSKESLVLEAQGESESAILRANAQRDVMVKEAEGQAESIRILNEANAKAIQLINDARPSKEFLQIKALESLEKVANGQATKIIIPSELQSLGGLLTSINSLTSGSPDPVVEE